MRYVLCRLWYLKLIVHFLYYYSDGASKCGMFCAVYNILERLDEINEVDVSYSVRQIQIRSPQSITSVVSNSDLHSASKWLSTWWWWWSRCWWWVWRWGRWWWWSSVLSNAQWICICILGILLIYTLVSAVLYLFIYLYICLSVYLSICIKFNIYIYIYIVYRVIFSRCYFRPNRVCKSRLGRQYFRVLNTHYFISLKEEICLLICNCQRNAHI